MPARIGFYGAGKIGGACLATMLADDEIEAAAICDPRLDCVAEALKLVPDAVIVRDLAGLIELGVDAVVLAGPARNYAAQAVQVLEGGAAVFCQHPLATVAAQAQAAVDAAKAANRLLGADLCYRFTEGMQRIREYVAGGELGTVFAADLLFHDGAAPAGKVGGCVSDLGTHLVDLALWTLGFPAVERVDAHRFAGGERLAAGSTEAEDYAAATLTLANGALVRIACSRQLATGREAVIEAVFHGTDAGAALRNVGGSREDFRAEIYRGVHCETLSVPGDAWRGRAAARWAGRLASGERFDKEAERLVAVAGTIERILGQ